MDRYRCRDEAEAAAVLSERPWGSPAGRGDGCSPLLESGLFPAARMHNTHPWTPTRTNTGPAEGTWHPRRTPTSGESLWRSVPVTQSFTALNRTPSPSHTRTRYWSDRWRDHKRDSLARWGSDTEINRATCVNGSTAIVGEIQAKSNHPFIVHSNIPKSLAWNSFGHLQ